MDPKCPTILASVWSLQEDEHLSMPHPKKGSVSMDTGPHSTNYWQT